MYKAAPPASFNNQDFSEGRSSDDALVKSVIAHWRERMMNGLGIVTRTDTLTLDGARGLPNSSA
jgi:hypothetical protein